MYDMKKRGGSRPGREFIHGKGRGIDINSPYFAGPIAVGKGGGGWNRKESSFFPFGDPASGNEH